MRNALTDLSTVDLLACCIYAEARGEPEAGQEAVAGVVRNRALRRRKTFTEIILARKQFSWIDDNNCQLTLDACQKETKQWLKCKIIATRAVYDPAFPDPSLGADHYLNVELTKKLYGKLPRWAEEGIKKGKVTVKIGRHTFLNLEGKL